MTMRVTSTRSARRSMRPVCESLEKRTVAAAGTHTVLGQIAGQVIDQSSGAGLRHVEIDLTNTGGRTVQRTFTNNQGLYLFNVTQHGGYVVHEHAPRGFVQISPSFTNAAPTGSYATGAGNSSWNYANANTNPANGQVGPAGWANIAPAGFESFESPINLHGPTVDLGRVLSVNYAPAVPSKAINNSHQIQVQLAPGSGDTITAGGTTYSLAQFHYHGPAENTVNHHAYSIEEHFVNLSVSGGEAVIAVYFKVGAHNSALDPILAAATAGLTTPNSTTTIPTPIDFAGLLPKNTRGWFYQGSLTTPPLSQPVDWFVYATPITLDRSQLNTYQSVALASGFYPNARPVQPIDGRTLNQIDAQINFTNQTFVAANFALAR